MANELAVGTRRQGSLIDFDPETPEVSVLMERLETGIRVQIPWSNSNSPYAGWFMGEEDFLGTPAPAKRAFPRRLLFQDSHGTVLLVGCWPNGYRTNIGGPGSGTISATYAVMGVGTDTDYRTINGIVSEISGLRSWLGVKSVSTKRKFDSQPGVKIATIEAEEIVVPGHARLLPTWRIEQTENSATLTDLVQCETTSADARDWEALLHDHRGIRDLLVMSQWRAETMTIRRACRDDDVWQDSDKRLWREVVSSETTKEPKAVDRRQHLIRFEEIGSEGIANWLKLREDFERAIDPIVSTVGMRRVSPATLLAQTGPGVEALGYLLFIRDGKTKRVASTATLRARLDRILLDVSDSLPFHGGEWADRTVRAYNSLKHANRAAPAEIDILNAWRETVLVVRAWIALEIGTPSNELKNRLAEDPQSSAWRVVDKWGVEEH